MHQQTRQLISARKLQHVQQYCSKMLYFIRPMKYSAIKTTPHKMRYGRWSFIKVYMLGNIIFNVWVDTCF